MHLIANKFINKLLWSCYQMFHELHYLMDIFGRMFSFYRLNNSLQDIKEHKTLLFNLHKDHLLLGKLLRTCLSYYQPIEFHNGKDFRHITLKIEDPMFQKYKLLHIFWICFEHNNKLLIR